MLLENGLLVGELRSGIGQLRLGNLDVAFRDQQLGLGDVLVALRLLGQPAARSPGGSTNCCLRLLTSSRCARMARALATLASAFFTATSALSTAALALRHLRLLLRGVQPGKHLALLDDIAVIGIELGDGRADLEADPCDRTRASTVPRPNTRTGTFSATGVTLTSIGRSETKA